MSPRRSLDDLLRPGLPAALAAELEDRLEAGAGDGALAGLVQESPVLLLALLRMASRCSFKSGNRPVDARGAWHQLGSRRARGLLRALSLLLPLQPPLPVCDRLLPGLRATAETLLPLCDAQLGPAAPTLLRLVELVPLDAELAGEDPPAWRGWGSRLLQRLAGGEALHPLLTDAAAAIAHPAAAPDPVVRRHGALLHILLARQLDPRGAAACDREVWTLLEIQPWNLGAVAGPAEAR
jgi:hypothetical protein